MTNETDILIAVQEAVRKALVTSANEEIEKQKHKFKCEMGKLKNELIGKLLNEIEICAKHDLPDDRYADVAPVHHGQWKCGKPCPICGEDRFKGLDADIWADWEPPYCPNCGSRMDEEVSE